MPNARLQTYTGILPGASISLPICDLPNSSRCLVTYSSNTLNHHLVYYFTRLHHLCRNSIACPTPVLYGRGQAALQVSSVGSYAFEPAKD
jgi:hypothetical protein